MFLMVVINQIMSFYLQHVLDWLNAIKMIFHVSILAKIPTWNCLAIIIMSLMICCIFVEIPRYVQSTPEINLCLKFLKLLPLLVTTNAPSFRLTLPLRINRKVLKTVSCKNRAMHCFNYDPTWEDSLFWIWCLALHRVQS